MSVHKLFEVSMENRIVHSYIKLYKKDR